MMFIWVATVKMLQSKPQLWLTPLCQLRLYIPNVVECKMLMFTNLGDSFLIL